MLGYAIAIVLLTVFTQVGGLVLLLSLPLLGLIQLDSGWLQAVVRLAVFLLLYALAVGWAVPKLAAWGGRVPLPCTASTVEPLRPANRAYCLLMRNYVTPDTREHLLRVARQFRQVFPNSTLRYLDAGFPFLNGFPLLPHLSHKDGRKVDLAFFYQLKATHRPVDFSPSWLGYWHYEQPPNPKEAACQEQAGWLRWDLDWLQAQYSGYALDEERTRVLLQLLVADAQKVLLEPHLQTRLGVRSAKLKFQGCHAARHDDHIHVQW